MSCLKCNKEYQVFTDEFTGEIEIYPVDEAYCIDCEMDINAVNANQHEPKPKERV